MSRERFFFVLMERNFGKKWRKKVGKMKEKGNKKGATAV